MINLDGIDRRISEISREVDFYSYLTPLNQKEERDKFFAYLEKGDSYNPVFKYKKAEYLYQEKWLKEAKASLDEKSGIELLFIKKIDFMIKQLNLLGSGDKEFTSITLDLYASPGEECLERAYKILNESKNESYEFPPETVKPEEMASILKEKLKEKGIGWEVTLSRKIIPKITVSAKDKTIYINSGINYTLEEVERLKIHEVEVHVFRGVNGSEQPFKIFRDGLAGYDETEEGLAILAEEKTGLLKTDTRQMKLYAGRALAADASLKASFYDTFILLREFFPDYIAYRLTERAKRGLKDTSREGGILRGHQYITGHEKIEKYVAHGGDLSILYVGKIGIEEVRTVKRLLEKGDLKPPVHLPDFIKA